MLALVALRVLTGTLAPVLERDEALFWALKAQAIYTCGGFNETFAQETAPPDWIFNEDYPNLVPLWHVWGFVQAGGLTYVLNRLPVQLCVVALTLVTAAGLRRVTRPLAAAVWLVLLVAVPQARTHAGLGQADLPLALGLVVTLDAWLRQRASGHAAWGWLAALALAFALWTKNEAQAYVLSIAVAWALTRLARRWRTDGPPELNASAVSRLGWTWLLLPAATLAVHLGFNAAFDFQSGFLANQSRDAGLLTLIREQFPTHAPEVLHYYATKVLFALDHPGLVLGVALLAVPPLLAARHFERALPGLALAMALGIQMLVLIGAPRDLSWHLKTAVGRITFQLLPVAMLWVAMLGQTYGRSDAQGD